MSYQPMPPAGGWNAWPTAPPPAPKPTRTLLGVLIVLISATIAIVAFGAVLLLRRDADAPVVSQPQTSTIAPATPTPSAAPNSEEPTQNPTAVPPTEEPNTEEPTTEGPTTEGPTTEEPSTEAPTPEEPTATTTKPPKPPKPTKPEDFLVRNPLYALTLPPSDCTQPPRPLPTNQKSDEKYLKNLIGCMMTAYSGVLKQAGFTLTKPDLLIYTGTVQTPCGQGLAGYPVFYCGANETVYSSAGSTARYGETLRLGGYWIVMHEFGHHIQQRIGILESGYTRNEEQLQISRRIELQADCFMGMTSSSVRSTRLSDQDRQELVTWRNAAADQIHGQSSSQIYWVNRGFDTNAFSRCVTWTGNNHIS